MATEQASAVQRLLARYLGETDERSASYRALARRHALLPILPDWSGFVGLRDDGALFWVSEDNGSISSDLNEHVVFLAQIRGAELFPELDFLAPKPSQDWVQCWSCGGSGRVTIDGQYLPDVRCQCGGLGTLPPSIARSLRTHVR